MPLRYHYSRTEPGGWVRCKCSRSSSLRWETSIYRRQSYSWKEKSVSFRHYAEEVSVFLSDKNFIGQITHCIEKTKVIDDN